MEEKKALSQSHNITMENRQKISFTGVKDIGAFSEEQVLLSTVKGGIIVKGADLKVQKLDVDDGKVIITGTINSLTYSDKGEKKDRNILGKIFK